MINKFIVAFQGFVSSLQDKSVQIQYILAILACIAAWILGCNYYEWLAILLCIGFCDSSGNLKIHVSKNFVIYIRQKKNEKIKFIKDLGAGGVLFTSMIALSVGILIFIHHLF